MNTQAPIFLATVIAYFALAIISSSINFKKKKYQHDDRFERNMKPFFPSAKNP